MLKRHDYAAAGITDYWIVDREARLMTVLTLDPGSSVYREDAILGAGQTALVGDPAVRDHAGPGRLLLEGSGGLRRTRGAQGAQAICEEKG